MPVTSSVQRSIFFVLSAWLALVLTFFPTVASATPISGADLDMGKLYIDDFGFTEYTTEANNATAADVSWPFTGGASVYFGSTSKFQKIYFYLSAENVSGGWTPGGDEMNYFQFYNGTDWENITVTNDTGAWDGTGIHTFSFTPDADWAVSQVNSEGTDYYYIRINGCDMGCNQMNGSIDMDQVSLLSYSGGAAVPEFSDLLYILIIAGSAVFLWYKVPRRPANPYAGA